MCKFVCIVPMDENLPEVTNRNIIHIIYDDNMCSALQPTDVAANWVNCCS